MCNNHIYVLFCVDEEIGGGGMRALLECKEFIKMNIGFALDEGNSLQPVFVKLILKCFYFKISVLVKKLVLTAICAANAQ